MNLSRPILFLFGLCIGLMSTKMVVAQSDTITGIVSVQEILENDRIYGIYKNRYQPDKAAIEYLSTYSDSIDVIVFWGSWCKESKRYIPGLIKTMEQTDNPNIRVEYVGVNSQKELPKEFLIKVDIKYIPTVVVLKDNVELGRIEEKPLQSIETDFVQILQKVDKEIE